MILKLLFMVGFYLLLRTLFASLRRSQRSRAAARDQSESPEQYKDLTSQEISDADFEDLPDEPS